MAARPNSVAANIDLTGPGKRLGHLELVWSDNVHAYGVIPIPIGIVSSGPGPCVLITAGVHGDEYEGLVIARRLYRELEPSHVEGTVIVMPAVNLPAVRAATRVSPLDRVNMNRAFLGDRPHGPTAMGPTAMIADFIETRLLPRVQLAIDLHSGGTRSIFMPCGYVYAFGPPELRKRKLAACHAFGLPHTAVVAATSSGGSLSAACERHGVVMVATELGGAAVLDRHAMQRGYEGVRALLCHAGVTDGAVATRRTSLIHVESRQSSVMARIDGLFEHAVDVGDDVEAGQLAGRIWPMDDPTREPVALTFDVGGTVLARRATPLVLAGDTVCHTGRRISDQEFMTIGDGGRS
jgi:predicted deacylase